MCEYLLSCIDIEFFNPYETKNFNTLLKMIRRIRLTAFPFSLQNKRKYIFVIKVNKNIHNDSVTENNSDANMMEK
jgi:hypothetical protein